MGHCMFLRKGETHTAPLSGILASDIAVGSTVKLMENGVAVDYLVVNQGIPSGSSLYDSSCDGMWVLRKDSYVQMAKDSSNTGWYSNCSSNTYLNDTFYSIFDDVAKAAIKQIKLPYTAGSGLVYSGEKGLSVKAFSLSAREIGWDESMSDYVQKDGALLSYFLSGDGTDARSKRIAYMNGKTVYWWTRSTYGYNSNNSWFSGGGTVGQYSHSYDGYTIRPALVLPSTALFDKTTLILKGVA